MSNSSSSKNSGKLSVDNHQATLDRGLKMKIKRTKMGNKTSDSKHEIVKSEAEMDEQNSKNSFLSNVNKRGIGNSHRKEKQSKTYFKQDKQEATMQDPSCNSDSEKMLSSPSSSCFKGSPKMY